MFRYHYLTPTRQAACALGGLAGGGSEVDGAQVHQGGW
jgi:hypothetical protein